MNRGMIINQSIKYLSVSRQVNSLCRFQFLLNDNFMLLNSELEKTISLRNAQLKQADGSASNREIGDLFICEIFNDAFSS
jgi:hypothetical protein